MAQQRSEPFDETAALAELERLRDSITAARRAREQKSDEFDAFVESFRKPPSSSLPAPDVATAREPAVATPAAAADVDAVVAAAAPHPPAAAPKRPGRYLPLMGVSAVAGALALGWLIYRSQIPSPSPPTTTSPDTSRPAAPAAAETPEPPSVPASPQAVVVRLRTLRPVWMRVVVDGRKTHEGTVGGGEQLQLGGDRSIVVRVGNGGDVVVNTSGGERPFGEAGLPVTRTFARQ